MARMMWDRPGIRTYDHGVDRVAIYPFDEEATAWSGVTQITSNLDSAVESFYLDGLKYLQLASYGEYSATIEAVSYPNELRSAMGFASVSPGLLAANQRRTEFGLVYRTFSGDEIDGDRSAYKLHLVYNALASISLGASTTNAEATDAARHSWDVITRPPENNLSGLRPTTYLVVDSRSASPEVLENVEDILYGAEDTAPRLPAPQEMQTLFA